MAGLHTKGHTSFECDYALVHIGRVLTRVEAGHVPQLCLVNVKKKGVECMLA